MYEWDAQTQLFIIIIDNSRITPGGNAPADIFHQRHLIWASPLFPDLQPTLSFTSPKICIVLGFPEKEEMIAA